MPSTESDRARAYLLSFLQEKRVDLKTASLAVGKNHAYLQQYVKIHKPMWLPEQVRVRLVRLYGMDDQRLKPADALSEDNRSTEDGFIELVRLWSSLSKERRNIALLVLKSLKLD